MEGSELLAEAEGEADCGRSVGFAGRRRWWAWGWGSDSDSGCACARREERRVVACAVDERTSGLIPGKGLALFLAKGHLLC